MKSATLYHNLWEIFKEYCYANGAERKVYGDNAFRSPLYDQKTNRGRYIKLIAMSRTGQIIICDNKKGVVILLKDDS